MDNCLLTLITKPDLEDELIDWLSGRDELSGFSSLKVSGHSREHAHLSLVEQVTGQRRQIMFQVQTTQANAQHIVIDLRSGFPNAWLRYWATPLCLSGVLNRES